jgi:hypothetical protein
LLLDRCSIVVVLMKTGFVPFLLAVGFRCDANISKPMIGPSSILSDPSFDRISLKKGVDRRQPNSDSSSPKHTFDARCSQS